MLIISTIGLIPYQLDNSKAIDANDPQVLAPITFTNVSEEVGLAGTSGNFFAWGDYNNDGYQDLLVNGNRLFKNSGPPSWKFTDVTDAAKISTGNYGTWGDYDNDGWLDFYAPGQDELWHNNGDGTFSDVTFDAGTLKDEYPSVACGWGDYDRDSYIDLYIANYENENLEGYPDTFWKNNGNGTFTNVTTEVGIIESEPSRGVSWGDYNDDGWPDIYISNYRIRPNHLWENNKNGTFTNVAVDKGVEGHETVRLGALYYGHTVGSAWADYDNDGDFDIWSTNLAHKDLLRGPVCDDSYMFRNDGPVEQYGFTDVRTETGIPTKVIGGGEDELMVGVAWGDYDNDGYQDLFLPQIYNDLTYAFSYLYHNDGDGTFTEVSNAAGVRVWDTYGGAWCDYNNDGWLDLVTGGKGDGSINGTHEIHLYKNSGNSNNWLQLTLVGTVSNAAAIGARVEVTNNITTQLREVEGGMGSHSMQNSLTLEYGWGSYTGTVDISIRWPSGIVQNIGDINLNQNLKIIEPEIYPDLAITKFFSDEVWPIEGEQVRLQGTIENLGEIYSAGAEISISEYHWDSDTTKLIFNSDVEPLEAGPEPDLFTKIWDSTGKLGNYTFTAILSNFQPGDQNQSNNELVAKYTVYVRPYNPLPVAVLEAEPTEGGIGQKVAFDAKKSYDDLAIYQYRFYFGDGSDSDWIYKNIANHTYLNSGEYDAYVVVKDIDFELSNTQNPDSHQLIKINGTIPINHAPLINKVDYQPQKVAPGGTVKINVDATDEDDDKLTYFYSAAIGTISGSGDEVRWYAPQEEGEYTISVYVSDGLVDSDKVEITITVSKDAPTNLPPVINSLKVTPPVIGLNGDATVTVDAYDPEDNNLLYVYSVTGGKISGTGSSVRYISPGTEGKYQISVFVNDGELDSLTATTAIEVFENDPPELAAIIVDPEMVPAGSIATITVLASDPDGDELSFSYIPEAGDITGTGKKVEWTAPVELGEYELTVIVTDPMGFGAEDSIRIKVIFPGEGPQILNYELLPNIVGNDGTAEVVVTVELVHPFGPSYIENVYLDLSDVGGKTMQELYDSGRHGDESRNDGIYTYKFGIPMGTEPGDYDLYVSVEDTDGKLAGTNLMLEVIDTTESESKAVEGISTTEKLVMIAIAVVISVVVILFALYMMNPKKPIAIKNSDYS